MARCLESLLTGRRWWGTFGQGNFRRLEACRRRLQNPLCLHPGRRRRAALRWRAIEVGFRAENITNLEYADALLRAGQLPHCNLTTPRSPSWRALSLRRLRGLSPPRLRFFSAAHSRSSTQAVRRGPSRHSLGARRLITARQFPDNGPAVCAKVVPSGGRMLKALRLVPLLVPLLLLLPMGCGQAGAPSVSRTITGTCLFTFWLDDGSTTTRPGCNDTAISAFGHTSSGGWTQVSSTAMTASGFSVGAPAGDYLLGVKYPIYL